MKFQTLTALSALVASVSAHGYVDNITLAGKIYTGYLPYQDIYTNPIPDRIVRPVHENGPVEDLTLIYLQCGGYSPGGVVGSKPAKLTGGPAAAGSTVSLAWTLWPESHGGPVITYMAKLTDETNSAVWFKIAEASRQGTTDVWADTPMTKPGYRYEYKIPSCLAAGSYLVRHEIIALHGAGTYPGVQFYPSCHQIKITGSGTSTGPSSKVAFPGAYKATDPGITYNMYAPSTYTIPGPPLFKC
ncbi:hypothetical protein HYALB_00008354 [Hymenoscyphus albidus]|uniref:lytic cellulose monooxygenase (C4-dehydrogenating) n=1 Tax=Hymenoscyphus albidus TaxID=595503 RepID=A0A9N9PWL0_9HELO|nr:hypothetical protein HYALB_00008354 [Hymenoscyphus albidus]